MEAQPDLDPEEIILARRRKGYGTVSVDAGELINRARDAGLEWQPAAALTDRALIEEGDVIPMRRAEAEGREDFEPVEEGI